MQKHLAGIFILLCLVVFLWPKGKQPANQAVSAPPPAQPAAVETPAPEVAATLATCMYENFGGCGNPKYATSWYPLIKSITAKKTSDGEYKVDVYTDIYNDSDAQSPSRAIAGALYFNSTIRPISSVTVWGVKGGYRSLLYHKYQDVQ
jgi:hypothetical protein